MFVAAEELKEWKDAFGNENFKTMDFPFFVLYDIYSIKKRKTFEFPHNNVDLAFIAKYPGLHPDGFSPSLESQTGESKQMAKFASLMNFKACSRKWLIPNSKNPVDVRESNVKLYAHVLDLFAPERGVFMDTFGSTLAYSIA